MAASETDRISPTTEAAASAAYARFGELARRYALTLSRSRVTPGGQPLMLLLGNHSSGKSTLVNWLLGGEAVQDVGLAPTDDGFTLIAWGETDAEFTGAAALEKLPAEFAPLSSFGPGLLAHLKLRLRNRALLRDAMLIDTPGMIDSASGSARRDYDFTAVVQALVELCDMVYFLFDPDKPGTTGETLDVFSKCLRGREFKLRVLMNKCDQFAGMYDFARCYGTLCWNLARALGTKDLPKLLTVYSGAAKPAPPGMDFSDFERHRQELLSTFANAGQRRHDNLLSQTLGDFTRLSIRMAVLNHVSRRMLALKALLVLFGAGASGLVAFAAWVLLRPHGALAQYAVGAFAFVASVALFYCLGLSLLAVRRWMLARRADEIFEREFRARLFLSHPDDVRSYWGEIRAETVTLIRSSSLDLPLFGEFHRRRVVRAGRALNAGFGA